MAITGAGTSTWPARAASAVMLGAVVVFGEAGIVALTGVGRHVAGGANAAAWAVATVLNAVAAYVLVGLPQLRVWAAREAAPAELDTRDPRARFAARTLSGGGLAAFCTASVVGGPLAVGWYYGRRRDPRARSLTWTASWLLAAVWSAVYLGLLAWAF